VASKHAPTNRASPSSSHTRTVAGRFVTAREVIDAYLAAMQRGDRETALGMYADDVVTRIPGRSAFAGEHHGRDALVSYIMSVVALAPGGTEVERVDTLAGGGGGGERVALLLHERLRGEHGEVEFRRANVYTVRDGRIAELRIYEHDQYELDAFIGA
jgi:ketosteroid isomerase-like protein